MKKLNLSNPFILFMLGGILSGAVFFVLNAYLSKWGYLYGFFFKFWPIQLMNTWLFGVAISFVVARHLYFRDERWVLKNLKMPQGAVSYEEAQELIGNIPEQFSRTLCFRRISEILKSYLSREEVIRLNEELSRRDLSQVERGHFLLDSLRQIIPVVGFLGTVIGLSLGMVKFPEILSDTGNIEGLRDTLKDFAVSLGVAFDTTLLALVYTIIVILLATLLRGKEEEHIVEIDEKTRELIAKLKSMPEDPVQGKAIDSKELERVAEIFQMRFQQAFNEVMEKFWNRWERKFPTKK